MRKTFVVALACAMLAGMGMAVAQPYPTRPVTMIVPYGAGGPLDTLARILSERMRISLGQSMIVENVTGASGTIGVGRAVRAAPDGYTVSVGNWPTHVINGATFVLQYDMLRDLEPVALLSSNPYVVVGRKNLPAKDLRELIAWLTANPENVTLGTAGPGSGQHVSGAYFQKVTGVSLKFVPYRAGSSDIMRDLVGGHIDLTFDQAITALPYVRNGDVRAFAVTANTRLAAAPDIPTVDEVGAPGVYISTWSGLWVPKGTPKDVIRKLTDAAMDALADPAVRQRLADLGQAIPPREQQTAEALGAHHKAEIEKWWPIIKPGNTSGTSVDATEPKKANRNGPGQPVLAVGPSLEVEPSVPTEFFVRVGGPTDALPPHSYVQINNLPMSVTLSEGQRTPAGSWVVPLLVLERLRVTAPADLPKGSEFIITLVDGDGIVLLERTIALYVTPAAITARADKKVNETQAPRTGISTAPSVASAPVPGPVSADPPERKSVAPVRPAPTREERAQAERLLKQGERHLAEGNISIARQYFLRAAELGLPIAALKMAETHDPSALAGVNVRGLVPDPVEARKWYQRALELGVPEAKARLQQLGRR